MAINLSNVALDIGNEEMVKNHRQQKIENILLTCYAEKIAFGISKKVKEECFGCLTDNLSQKNHQCLMMDIEDQILLYFDSVLVSVSEAEIVEMFMNRLQDMKAPVNIKIHMCRLAYIT